MKKAKTVKKFKLNKMSVSKLDSRLIIGGNQYESITVCDGLLQLVDIDIIDDITGYSTCYSGC